MRLLESLVGWLNRALFILAGVAIVALMLVATANVILRLFGMPFIGTYETVGFLGALVLAFTLGITQRRKEHVVVDIFSMHFPAKVNRITDILQFLVTWAFFAIGAWQVWVWGNIIRTSGEVSETLKLPFYPIIYLVALGFALLALNLLLDMILRVTRPAAVK
jgi:TRAP-type C4-dicarboxylate transport system permease small subunit